MSNAPLKILKASAGSGKTYALVQEYLRIVLKQDNMNAFSRIMAMTFTNKAALEMKERVLKALVILAYQEDKDKEFIDNTSKNLEMNPNEMGERAKKILKRILHNFSDLSIQTIDKFNIRLIRSFTRDLDLPGDFEIILDTEELIEKTIDKLIDSVGEKGKENLSKLLIEFARYNVDEERSWDFKRSLLDFMKLSEKEEFKSVITRIQQTDFTKEKKDELHARIKSIEKEFDGKRSQLLKPFFDNAWTVDHFKTGNHHLHGRMVKLASQKIDAVEALTDSMLVSIDKELENPRTQVPADFYRQVLDFYNWMEGVVEQYRVFTLSEKSFYQLSLLKHITSLINEVRKRENLLQISEVNSLISELIQSESAPFIYERIGTRFDNYLLDEFQDTSRLQWLNLIPLVEDSLGNNNANLIVGDAKQAIYRFRNGLVEQFAALPKIYNPENSPELARKSSYFEEMSISKTLKDNYRSKKEIVEFNNALFGILKDSLSENYQDYYNSEDLVQTPKGSSGGFVHFKIVNTKEDESSKEEISLEFLDAVIEQVINDDYSYGDICLLSRNKKECELWANHLIKKGIHVISDEGMKVNQSPIVKFIVAYLNYRKTPLSDTKKLLLAESFYVAKKQEPFISLQPFMTEKHFDFDLFCMQEFNNKTALDFTYENLYDLSQQILKIIQFDELDDPYVHYFCNMLLQFDLNNGPDLSQFLEYYQTKGYKVNVPLPERNNAITIMTAHKSKGLEFPIVILPDLAWSYSIFNQEQYLYEDPYHNEIYLGGITLKGTKRQAEVHVEKEQANLLDSLNLFYVSCTRAIDRLYALVDENAKAKTLGKLISTTLQQVELLQEIEEKEYVYGSRTFTPHPFPDTTSFKPTKDNDRLWFPDISLIDKDSIDDLDISVERLFGKDLHRVMQEINSVNDIEQAIDSLAESGIIQKENSGNILKTLEKLIEIPEIVTTIFPQASETVLNEREIVVSKKERIRPDRVIVNGVNARIIDFKTGLPRAKDEKQVQSYASALKEIGYETCTAFLLYTDTLIIKQVTE